VHVLTAEPFLKALTKAIEDEEGFQLPDLEDWSLPSWEEAKGFEEEDALEAAPPDSETDAHGIGWFLTQLESTHIPSEEEQKGWLLAVREGKEAAEKLAERLGLFPLEIRLVARRKLLELEGNPPWRKELDREGRRLWEKVLQGEEALIRTVEGNLRLVVHVAKRYVGSGVHLVDLVSYGSLGLIEAAERFDLALGHRFSTYAYWWVRQKVSKGARDLYRESGEKAPLSLDEGVGDEARFMDFIASDADPAAAALDKLTQDSIWNRLYRIGRLHALALGLHTGLVTGEPLPVSRVAEILDVSRGEAERLIAEAKKRSRYLLRDLEPEITT